MRWSRQAPMLETGSDRLVTTEELRRLASGDLIAVGAHTLTHPVLAGRPTRLQHHEIAASKMTLEDVLGRRVSAFAYPFGKHGDYTNETVKIVVESGFDLACSNFAGLIGKAADRWQLPRTFMGDWSGEELERQLRVLLARQPDHELR